MKTVTAFIFLFLTSLSAMGQADQIINSSINAHVPPGEASFLGFIITTAAPGSDVDVVILAEGAGQFDPVVRVYLDSTSNPVTAFDDDWMGSHMDYPNNATTENARSCFMSLFSSRLGPLDSLILLSVTTSGGSRSIFTEVRGYNDTGGKVNLQLLQVNGPLAGTCPDF